MGSKAEQLLVVLSVVEGRQFPRRPRHELVVQAKFDGEQLATDPVEHIEQPQFCTELAWELDRKTLQQHRLQRTPIKVQCFAVNSATSARELVGYIILDLRSVQEVKKAPKWHPLLNSKYTKLKPAILLSLVLENDSKEAPEQVKAKDAPRRDLAHLSDVVLREDEGYHQIGPPDCCTDFFVLSVTVAFATNLEQLIPCTMRLSLESPHFFFYYTLLGNDITSEPFETLISPSFEPERASVRVRSSVQVFRAYLSQQPNLQIHLCCGNSSLGSAEIPLANLVKAGVDLEKQPATVEGAFVLVPLSEAKHNQLSIPADLQPKVGVSITVRREGIDTEVGSPCLQRGGGQHTPVKKGTQSPRFPGSPVGEQKPRPVSPSCCSPIPLVHPPTESKSNNFLEHPDTKTSWLVFSIFLFSAPGPSVPSATQIQTEPEPPTSSVGISLPKISIPASAHHYYFSMDLRSIQGMDVGFSAKCILRYSYQFFGNVSPITTCPPVEVKKNVEVLLPKSYCAFEFAALPHQMQETFLRMPLVVEVLHRDANAEDLLLGTASVQLSHLLTAEKTRFVGQFGQEHWKQSFSETIPVVRARGPNDKVADLNYVTTLEDLGLVRVQDVLVSESMQVSDGAPGQPPSAVVAPTELRETMEYKVAMELEAWKELQEDLFDSQLKQKELRHMQELLEETRRRDREREALVKKKVLKCCLNLELTGNGCSCPNAQMQRLQKELKAKHELSMREVQESSRRLREDCLHQVELERSKVRLLEEERSRLQQQIREADTKYKQLEKEFQLYREQQNTKPEVRLQSEINLLSLEKVELERKLESTTKSKLHYKQQWGRALKELARFKQREQEAAMMRLKKQQQELEHMRLRYLAAEEKETVKSEKQQLEDIRNELNRLKQQEDKRPPMELPQEPSLSESTDDHLSRLLEERDTLLRTGVYTHEDRIIAELNRQIQEAMSRRPAR
uniref:Centrosomal protein 120 n=1 Tax=Scleropages formosus TaxID=113540 RepID=A0A8C9WAA4_SCLFO